MHGKQYMLEAYVLKGKGPRMILGFPFLEEHHLMVDCRQRVLWHVGGEEVSCFPMNSSTETIGLGHFFREATEGILPMWPMKKFPRDAGWDIYTPCEISLLPGQQIMVDTGICCQFLVGSWGQLCEKSGLAYKYRLTILGGVIDKGTLAKA